MIPQVRLLPFIRPNRIVGAAVAVLGLAVAGTASAQGIGSRADTWEFTVAIPYLASQTVDADGGTEVDVNSDVGLGFGLGYNFDDKLALSVDVAWSSPSYDATIASADTPPAASRRSNGELDTSNWQLNLRYNFMPGSFTPFVSGGLGWTYVDTNIADGPPGASCWWDPWYGNICYSYQETYSDWRFSYNVMAGARWDLNETVFLRAGIGKQWLDLDSGSQDFTGGRVEIGFSM